MKKKFITDKISSKSHWEFCEKNKLPYIEVSYFSEDYSTIFYDITNLKVDIQQISDELKKIYISYLDFLLLNEPLFDDFKNQYYYMNFLVKNEHVEDIANSLFDYIENKFLK